MNLNIKQEGGDREMPNKQELIDFAENVLDMACEVLGVDNPLDKVDKGGKIKQKGGESE